MSLESQLRAELKKVEERLRQAENAARIANGKIEMLVTILRGKGVIDQVDAARVTRGIG